MTVILESGYSLPSGDQPLTHARIAHSLNWLSGGTASASSTATGFFAGAPNNSLTYERWKPSSVTATWEYDHGSSAECDYCCVAAHTFGTNNNTILVEYDGASRTNLLTYSEQLDQWSTTSSITLTQDATIAPDGNTTAEILAKNAGTFVYMARKGITVAGQEYTASIYLKQGTAAVTAIRLYKDVTEGEPLNTLSIDWSDPDATGTDVGNGWYRFSITATAVDTGINVLIYPAGSSVGTGTVFAWGAQLEEGTKATPYIKTTASTASSTWYALTEYTTLTSDEPIMFIFEPETRQRWRISITGGTAPEVGVIKFGTAMQMERPIYGGVAPIPMARQTILRSNYSETGEYLGRVQQRSYLSASYSWQHLTSDWVRANWPDFQRAAEAEPFWLAWRPGTFGDVGYCQVDEVPIPSNMGIRDLLSVSMSVRARGYD